MHSLADCMHKKIVLMRISLNRFDFGQFIVSVCPLLPLLISALIVCASAIEIESPQTTEWLAQNDKLQNTKIEPWSGGLANDQQDLPTAMTSFLSITVFLSFVTAPRTLRGHLWTRQRINKGVVLVAISRRLAIITCSRDMENSLSSQRCKKKWQKKCRLNVLQAIYSNRLSNPFRMYGGVMSRATLCHQWASRNPPFAESLTRRVAVCAFDCTARRIEQRSRCIRDYVRRGDANIMIHRS